MFAVWPITGTFVDPCTTITRSSSPPPGRASTSWPMRSWPAGDRGGSADGRHGRRVSSQARRRDRDGRHRCLSADRLRGFWLWAGPGDDRACQGPTELNVDLHRRRGWRAAHVQRPRAGRDHGRGPRGARRDHRLDRHPALIDVPDGRRRPAGGDRHTLSVRRGRPERPSRPDRLAYPRRTVRLVEIRLFEGPNVYRLDAGGQGRGRDRPAGGRGTGSRTPTAGALVHLGRAVPARDWPDDVTDLVAWTRRLRADHGEAGGPVRPPRAGCGPLARHLAVVGAERSGSSPGRVRPRRRDRPPRARAPDGSPGAPPRP